MDKVRARNVRLVAENSKLRKRVKRFAEQLERSINHAVDDVVIQSSKEKGIITPAMRLCVLDLANHGVPMDHIAAVILAVSDAFGIQLDSAPSARSCRRIVKEGGILDSLHTMDLLNHAEHFTISGDGTSHKNLNYEVKHVTVTDYLADPSLPEAERKQVLLVGLDNTSSHTSEAQLNGWENLCHVLHKTHNDSPLGREDPVDTRTFYTKACGMLSDHAPDQKKTCRLWVDKREKADLEMRGEAVIRSLGGEELVEMITEINDTNIRLAGGIVAWEATSEADRQIRYAKIEQAIVLRVGREAFEKLPPEEQTDARRFVWGGCAMHKAINASKGAFTRLALTWPAHEHAGPIILFNKDNAAAAASTDPALKARAERLSGRGGVKLVELMGMLLNNSNKKLGQQDMHAIWFESQIHITAEIIAHLALYIEFLEFIREHKGSGQWTNLEENIYNALHCHATLADLVAMTLYSQSCDIPYMRIVRTEILNQLDLPPTNDKAKALCRKVIADPGILCGSEVDYKTAALDGKQWQRPDAVYAARAMVSKLPLVAECVKFTFEGALETWERFTEDERSQQRVGLTEQQKLNHLLKPTNDHSEGGAGQLKKAKQRAPNATMEFIDSKTRWGRNKPKGWVKKTGAENPHIFDYARVTARTSDDSGQSKRKRIEIAEEAKDIATTYTRKRVKTKARRDEKQKELDACVPIEDSRAFTDPTRLKSLRNSDLDLQIDWHRSQEKEVLGKLKTASHSSLSNRPKKVAAIVAAIKQRLEWVKSGLIKEFYMPPDISSDEDSGGEQEGEPEMDIEDDRDIVGFGG
ncbi:hypothetical protein BDZ89DRAFT_1192387 [Hymenopellis radicata]|nr:hypothetical protein BDZ89DRAFT_1192387 [Hymenopellis radicata]